MPTYPIDIVVESGPSGYFMVLYVSGQEIEREWYPTREAAMEEAQRFGDFAKKQHGISSR